MVRPVDKPRRQRPILGRVEYPTQAGGAAAAGQVDRPSPRLRAGLDGPQERAPFPSGYAPTSVPASRPPARSAREAPLVPPTHARFHAISTRCPQLLMTVVAHRRPLGHTVQRKPPGRDPKSCPARSRSKDNHLFRRALCLVDPRQASIPGPAGGVLWLRLATPRSCPPRHTRGFVTSNSALPNCCTPANHSSVRPGTQRSLRDTHRALLGGFLVLRSFCSASAIS